jgi:hypothetical protein
MVCNFCVTIKTRIPSPAALEPQSDDIRVAIPMTAPSFRIYLDPKNLDAVDVYDHLGCR